MKIPIPFTEKLNTDPTSEHSPKKFRWVFDFSGKQGEMFSVLALTTNTSQMVFGAEAAGITT